MSHVLITGGTGGIGKASAIELARAGHTVTITARDERRAAAALDEISGATTSAEPQVVMCDLASLASVRAAAAGIRASLPPVDVLVNNAGLAAFGRRRTTDDGFERQFGVNHLAHFLLTTLLDDHVTQRVVNVSSAGYGLASDGLRWDDLQWEREYDGWQAYGASKLCNLYFTWELADRWRDRGVTANAVHPGFVDTDLGYRRPEEGGKPKPPPDALAGPVGEVGTGATKVDLSALGAPKTAADGARTSVYVATAPELADVTGAYFDDEQQQIEVSAVARDRDASARLWAISEQLVGSAGT